MKVNDLMTTNVESINPRTSLRQAARKMADLGIGSLPIVENDELIGIITDRDISCHAVALGHDANNTEVQKVMTGHVATCFNDQEIEAAASIMESFHVRRLAVVDHDHQLTGFLSVDDLARVSSELAGKVLDSAESSH